MLLSNLVNCGALTALIITLEDHSPVLMEIGIKESVIGINVIEKKSYDTS